MVFLLNLIEAISGIQHLDLSGNEFYSSNVGMIGRKLSYIHNIYFVDNTEKVVATSVPDNVFLKYI